MKNSPKTFGPRTLGLVIYLACVFLWRFCWARWPAATDVAAWIAGVVFVIWYFWRFFFVPFRVGLRGNDPE